jgi:TIR domain-containing protein
MGDIFISYAREDHLAAARLADALKRNGWSVWWDPEISPGDIWDELIERELANVCCVVVLWSATSIHKQWVKAEATEAHARGILVPVLIEDVKPPLAFRQIQAAPLANWRGERDHAGFQQLLCTICKLVGSGRLCEAGSKSAKGARRVAAPKNEEMRLDIAPRPSAKRHLEASVRAELASAPVATRRRHLSIPGERLTVVGAAAALFLFGGTIGYALDNGVKLLSWQAPAGETGDHAAPLCEPSRQVGSLYLRPDGAASDR